MPMDFWMGLGGVVLIVVGLVAWFRAEWLWRLYSLEPRWRKDHPEQPDDWDKRAKRQGYYFIAFGVIVVLLGFVLAT